MAHTIEYKADPKIIEVVLVDDYDLREAKVVLYETAQAVKTYQCPKILVDVRRARINLSVLELYDAPKLIADSFSDVGFSVHAIKRAVVIPENSAQMRFLENVDSNRGHRMKLFREYSDAMSWLIGSENIA